MAAAGDKKRKKTDSGKASPAKKRKVDVKKDDKKKAPKKPAKSEPAKAKKAAPASKVKKSSEKGSKAKQTDTKAKGGAKNVQKSSSKKSEKDTKRGETTNNASAKSATKSKTVPKKATTAVQKQSKAKATPQKTAKSKPAAKSKATVKTVARTTSKNTAASKKAQATVAKAKLKAIKSLAKPKQAQTKKEPVKAKAESKTKEAVKAKVESKPKATKVETKTEKEKKSEEKPKEVKKNANEKQKQKEEPEKSPVKRKITSETEPIDMPRKKRVITPNKRYADFETDTSPKRISELRAFVQDKKNTPTTPKSDKQLKAQNQGEKVSKAETSPVKKSATTSDDGEVPKKSPEIKVIKASEMKPAEKLLKKLQKKLEREAKAAFAKPKQSPNKDSVKTKITKVVTYNKPAYSKFTKTEAKQLFPKEKAKPAVIAVKKKPASNGEKVVKVTPKATPKAAPKAAPKVAPSPKKFREQKKDDRKIQTKFLFQKDVRQADDANTNCWITGIDIYKSGEIVLVDMSNKKIKLFSANFEYMSQAKLDTTPQDISISPVDAGLAFFTKPFSKEGIQKVNMDDGVLTLKDSFLTNGTNRGVKCIKSGILTSVQNGRYHDLDINLFKIDLLDYKGNTLKSVSVDQTGVRLFKLPLYFTVSNNEKQIVVSDCIRNNSYIVSLDMSGKIKFKFTGFRDNPITPRGLTTDDEDNIYVTEWERHNVYVLTPAGKRQQLLLDHTEQIKEGQDGLKKPYQLAYYKHENVGRIIVSQESCNTVKIFQIGQKQAEQNGAPAEAAKATVPETVKPASTETTTKPATPEPKVAVVKPVAKAPVTEEKPPEPAVTCIPVMSTATTVALLGESTDSPSKATVVATSILSEEHAYTTLAAPEEKKGETVAVTADPLPSDPIEEEGPEELSSIVDSIISNLNSRESNTLLPPPEPVVSDTSF